MTDGEWSDRAALTFVWTLAGLSIQNDLRVSDRNPEKHESVGGQRPQCVGRRNTAVPATRSCNAQTYAIHTDPTIPQP